MTTDSGSAPPDPAKRFGARQVDTPRSGYFLCRMVKNGPPVPCRIVVDFGSASVSIDGGPLTIPTTDPHRNYRLMSVWTYGKEIDETQYLQLLARTGERPDPFKPVDLTTRPPPF